MVTTNVHIEILTPLGLLTLTHIGLEMDSHEKLSTSNN